MRSAPSPPWAADPPPGESQNVDNPPSISGIAVGFGALSTILALVVVCLRIYARAFVVRGLKADDCQFASHAQNPSLNLHSR